MLLSFMLVVYWCLVYTIAGFIVLASVPKLRVTVLNLLAFVIGAFAGRTGTLYVYGAYRFGFLENYPITIGLVGAIAGGILLVWLKTRFIKTSDDRLS
jgi:uncharacterized membrane protein YeaQ/YmgE (transglycosylase-associated protein family)